MNFNSTYPITKDRTQRHNEDKTYIWVAIGGRTEYGDLAGVTAKIRDKSDATNYMDFTTYYYNGAITITIGTETITTSSDDFLISITMSKTYAELMTAQIYNYDVLVEFANGTEIVFATGNWRLIEGVS